MSLKRSGWRGIFYLMVVGGGAALVLAWWQELSAIWRSHGLTFLVAASIMCVGQIVQARNFAAFLERPANLNLWTLSGVWALSALANYAGPLQPGVAIRVIYLQRQGVAMKESLLATWRQLGASLWVALLGVGSGLWMLGTPQGRLPAVMCLLAFICVFLLRRIIARAIDALNSPAWLADHRLLLASAIGGSNTSGVLGVALQYVIGALLVWWVYARFGAQIELSHALIIACAVYVSALVAILPGNLGVLEGIYIFSAQGFGVSIQEGAALAFLLRAAHIASCIALSPLADRSATRGEG